MKIAFDFIFGFIACIFAVLGLSGIKALFSSFKEKKRINKMVDKISNAYEKIDSTADNRSDLDVLRKQ